MKLQLGNAIKQLAFGDFLFRLIPVQKQVVLFSSFFGQHYSDGPRAISEVLHERHPEITIYWAFADEPEKHELPPYIHAVKMGTLQYFYIKAIAANLVTNVFQQAGYLGKNTKQNLITRIHLALEQRRKQRVITTWHGTPLKKMANDEVGALPKKFICNKPMYYIVGNKFEEDIMMRLTDNQMISLPWGSPRSSKLTAIDEEKKTRLKTRIAGTENCRIVLYAPTFRYGSKKSGIDIQNSGLEQLNMIDFSKLSRVLIERFGGDNWILVCRFHNLAEKSIDWGKLQDQYCGKIINGNQLEDIMDYYYCADLVITDYSSVMYDFMQSNRPVVLFCHDYENYKENERGFYLSVKETPFLFAQTVEELYREIQNFDQAGYNKRVQLFMNKLGYYQNKDVLGQIADFIFEEERKK